MNEWKIEFYESANNKSPVLDWFNQQNAKVKARITRVLDLLKEYGITLAEPHVKRLDNKLYEIRAEQNTNIYRVIYFAHTGKRFILLHGFQKKTQMTSNTISWDSIRDEVLADPEVKAEYDALEEEFQLASHIISLRKSSGLNQRDFAKLVGIKQPHLARIESGKQVPKLETLAKLALKAGYTVEIHFIHSQHKQKVIIPTNELLER